MTSHQPLSSKRRLWPVVFTLLVLSGCGEITIGEDSVGVYLKNDGTISELEIGPNERVSVGFEKPGVSQYRTTATSVRVAFSGNGTSGAFIPDAEFSFEYRIDPNLVADFRIAHGMEASSTVSETLGRRGGSSPQTMVPGYRLISDVAEGIINGGMNNLLADRVHQEDESAVSDLMTHIVADIAKSVNHERTYFEFGQSALVAKGYPKYGAAAPNQLGVPRRLEASYVPTDEPASFSSPPPMGNLLFVVALVVLVFSIAMKFVRSLVMAGRQVWEESESTNGQTSASSVSETRRGETPNDVGNATVMKTQPGVTDYRKRLS